MAEPRPTTPSLSQRLVSEGLGSALLFATVIGSGIMGAALAGGNDAVALVGNTAATGAILFVLITMLGPVSGAHFNPAVTLVMMLRRNVTVSDAALYTLAQLAGGLIGVVAAHAMFDQPLIQTATTVRSGPGQWLGEGIATFGLLLTIIGTVRMRPQAVAASVALYITAGYWFTSSTSFANPAITIARSMSDSFAGIAPSDVPAFILAQLAGALAAWGTARFLFPDDGGGA